MSFTYSIIIPFEYSPYHHRSFDLSFEFKPVPA